MRKITATKRFKFDMAHKLERCETEKCKFLHGHGYCLDVTIGRNILIPSNYDLNEDGMVLDFKIIKEIVDPIIARYDHNCITQESCGFNPTTENLIQAIAMEIDNSSILYEKGCVLVKLKLSETDSSYIELS